MKNQQNKTIATSRLHLLALATIAGILLTSPRASAAVSVWDGTGADNNWTTPANWTTDALPANNGTADIRLPYNLSGTSSTSKYTINVDAPQSIHSVLFQNTGGDTNAYTLSGSKITITGTANNAAINLQKSGVTATINCDIDFSQATRQNITTTLNDILQFGGTVTASGAASLLYNGSNNSQTVEILGAGSLNVTNFTLQNTTPSGSSTAVVTLKLDHSTSLVDTMTLNLLDSSVVPTQTVGVNLAFSGNEVISALTINGATKAFGTYGAIGSGAQFTDSHFTGTGFLQVVPEPSTFAMALGGFGILISLQRLRRGAKRGQA